MRDRHTDRQTETERQEERDRERSRSGKQQCAVAIDEAKRRFCSYPFQQVISQIEITMS